MPVILSVHFIFVAIFKWHFERARHMKDCFLTNLVTFINIFASSLVFVRIVPIEKPSAGVALPSSQPPSHTTCLTQVLGILARCWRRLSGFSQDVEGCCHDVFEDMFTQFLPIVPLLPTGACGERGFGSRSDRSSQRRSLLHSPREAQLCFHRSGLNFLKPIQARRLIHILPSSACYQTIEQESFF